MMNFFEWFDTIYLRNVNVNTVIICLVLLLCALLISRRKK